MFSLSQVQVLLFLIGLFLTLWRSFECINKYLEFSRSSHIEMTDQEDTLMPALTICPDYFIAYNQEKLGKIGIGSFNAYKKGTWRGNSSDDAKTIFKTVTQDFDALIHYISFRFSSGLIKKYVGNNTDTLNVFEIYSVSFGRCYEIALSQFSNGIHIVEIVTNFDAYVYVNLPGQFNNDGSKSRVVITKNKMLFIEVTYEVLKMTSEETCKKYNSTQTYDCCTYQALAKVMGKHLQCTVPYHRSNMTICAGENNAKEVSQVLQVKSEL